MTSTTPPTWLSKLAGAFIVLEGPDGSGKSTQLTRLLQLLASAGVPVCHVREPGGTPVGEQIRNVLLDRNSEMTLHCEMLLYMASRAQLVEETIRPALAAKKVVIADRFVSSTYAYQGAGGGVPAEHIKAVADVALRGTNPHLVIIFDVDAGTAARRTSGVEHGGGKKTAHSTVSLFADRIEQRGREFQAKVRKGYLDQAKADPAHHIIINASRSPDEVWADLIDALRLAFQ